MDTERVNDAMDKFEKAYTQLNGYNTDEEYLQFSRFIQGLFISKNGWITDTGNFQTVNYALMKDVYYKVKKHPILWKLFFMIA